MPVSGDPHLFRKLFRRLFYAHIVRWCPLLHEGASSSGHHWPRDNAVDLHSISKALFGERFRKGSNSGINRGDGRKAGLGLSAALPDVNTTDPVDFLSDSHACIVSLRAP
jgi:hypothetical protein